MKRNKGKETDLNLLGRDKPPLLVFHVLLFMFLLAFSLAVMSVLTAQREQTAFEEIADRIGTPIAEVAAPAAANAAEPTEPENSERFAGLIAQNPDFAGWLTIEGTAIDYPVMLKPDEPDYYLHRDFDGNASASGTPFIGEGCALDSDNIIIHGHNMKNGTMFAELLNYADYNFWQEHPTLSFNTVKQSAKYEIITAFYEKVHYQNETDAFRYYSYGGELSQEQFNEYLSQIQDIALYDTGLTAEYGEQFITLSTCSYHTENGRFVVVARKNNRLPN